MLGLIKNNKNNQFLKLFVFSLLAVVMLPIDAFADTVISGGNVGGIFKSISAKAADAVANISQLAYILAGFGMVAFTFGAIFGKLSWKHFGNIAIGLMMVASSGMIIEFFVTPPGSDGATYRYKLSYGDYISDAVGDTMEQPVLRDPSDKGVEPIKKMDPIGFEPLNNGGIPGAGELAPMNGTGIPTVEKKKSFWEKAKEVGQAANDTAKTVKKGLATAEDVKSKAENIGKMADAAVDAIKSGDFDQVGDKVGRILSDTQGGLDKIGDFSNTTAGLGQELGDYANTGDYDKNSYKDNDTSVVDRIGDAVNDKVDGVNDTVEDVDNTADELDETMDTVDGYSNYLN